MSPPRGPCWRRRRRAAFLLGLVNLLIRPLILLLTLPFGFFVTFGVGFIVNAVVLLITSRLMPALQIRRFPCRLHRWSGVGSLINTIITGVITVDDDDSFYAGRRRAAGEAADLPRTRT